MKLGRIFFKVRGSLPEGEQNILMSGQQGDEIISLRRVFGVDGLEGGMGRRRLCS